MQCCRQLQPTNCSTGRHKAHVAGNSIKGEEIWGHTRRYKGEEEGCRPYGELGRDKWVGGRLGQRKVRKSQK